MEGFCSETIESIKGSGNEMELIKVISNSMSQLRKERKSFNESGYIMNMIVSLNSAGAKDLPENTLNNIKLAIDIFRQLQKENRYHIF